MKTETRKQPSSAVKREREKERVKGLILSLWKPTGTAQEVSGQLLSR